MPDQIRIPIEGVARGSYRLRSDGGFEYTVKGWDVKEGAFICEQAPERLPLDAQEVHDWTINYMRPQKRIIDSGLYDDLQGAYWDALVSMLADWDREHSIEP